MQFPWKSFQQQSLSKKKLEQYRSSSLFILAEQRNALHDLKTRRWVKHFKYWVSGHDTSKGQSIYPKPFFLLQEDDFYFLFLFQWQIHAWLHSVDRDREKKESHTFPDW